MTSPNEPPVPWVSRRSRRATQTLVGKLYQTTTTQRKATARIPLTTQSAPRTFRPTKASSP
jgi:hypothetical protein